ncbi:FAD-dependent oxidoreductase [Granulicella arctica]|uniref:FAD-dependent oxidoreductase n=1 Tax=Granulicella arctica TaxID=940613 RepID=UPI0021E055AA|nr:FAD-dependent oxidoreductase [Granulicella arctica]
MPKPILLAIDDDTSVLEAVVQDLRRHYGQNYRIIRAVSGDSALETCVQLKQREETVALFLSDQRMPGMSGIEFLQQAMVLFPDAKRVLLTAYADTEAAIRAINAAKIHYYLNKPWDPPEEKLYPVLDDLLESWKQGYRPAYEGIQVVGMRWSAADYQVRDFLARHRVEYKWLSPEYSSDALELLKKKGIDDSKMPVVLFGDGTVLLQPSPQELAAKLGLPMQAKQDFYDVIVIGAGPAGLAAGVYGASEGLRTLIVEGESVGGQAGSSSKIENYLGFPQGLSGDELAKRAYLQAQRLGAEFLTQRVTALRCENNYHVVQMADGRELTCHVCLVATGVSYCKLDIPGESKFSGAGMYYGAALTEAKGCAEEEIYIVGGANSAGQAAMHFSRFASKVHMLVRGESLVKSMSKYLIDQIEAVPNIVVEPFTEVVSMSGDTHLECLTLKTPNGEERRAANSLFVFIGASPKTDWLPKTIACDPKGFILAGPDLKARAAKEWTLERDPYLLETSVPGIFVAGDVRFNSVKRCASAVGEGSIAIQFVHQYLATL